MNVRAEIEEYALPEDKPVLLWLLGRYSRQSKWSFVADCRFERYGRLSYEIHRIWYPTEEGRILYEHLK